MSSSYKPALLKALVRLIRRGAGTSIDLHAIGHEFVGLYWTQTVAFRLRQAPTLARESEVVRRIRDTAERTKVRDVAALASDDRRELDRRMAAVLRINVLQAFHIGKPESMSELFTWHPDHERVEIPEDAHRFMFENATTLEALANLWWARYLERVNALAPLIIEKVERNGAKRRSIARYLDVLRDVDGNRCFYCEIDLAFARKTHIDHVIPWSFVLADATWNLVLACDSCNIAKSDTLPERTFIEKLDRLHVARSKAIVTRATASMLLLPGEIGRYYDAALSVEWPGGWVPTARAR